MDKFIFSLKARISILIVSLLTLSTSVSAQLSGNSRIPGTDFTISESINLILFWDLGSGAGFWLGLTMFIVVWLGFYFATKPFLQQLFDAMLDAFPSSDSRRTITTNDEGEIKGVNMLALLSAFATAQIIGQFFGLIPMIIIGFIPAVLGAWAMLKSGENFPEEFGNTLSGGTEGSKDSDLNLDERFNEMQEELEDELQREEDIKQKISRLRGEKEDFDTAADKLIADESLPSDVRNDLEYLRNEMDDEIQKEFSLSSILDEVAKEERAEIDELNDVENLAEYVRSEFSHLVELDNDLDEKISSLEDELQDMKNREQRDGTTPELREEFEDFKSKFEETIAEFKEESQKYEELSSEIEEINEKLAEVDNQTSQIRDKVEEADKEDDEIRQEAEDEKDKMSEIEQLREKYGLSAPKWDDEHQRALEEVYNSAKGEISVAEEAHREVTEEEDELVKIAKTKDAEKKMVQRIKEKLKRDAINLEEKKERLQTLREEANGLEGFTERAELEEEEFNEKLVKQVKNLYRIRDSSDLGGEQKVRQTEEAIRNIVEMRKRMPPEIKNRREGKYLENEQGNIYRLVGEIAELPEVDKSRIEEIENEYFPPLVQSNSGDDITEG